MATYRKRGGLWRAEVRRQGVYESRTFATKTEARAWATDIEAAIMAGRYGKQVDATLGDAMRRYQSEVSPQHKGARWESIRLNLLQRDPVAKVSMASLRPADIADWRDRRAKAVAPASVNRELNIISAVCNIARREWGWLAKNPCSDVRRLRNPRPRDRRISDDEIDRITLALGYEPDGIMASMQQQTAVLFLLALETAMRLSELLSLHWSDAMTGDRYVILRDTKNTDSRQVPLSSEAVRLLGQLDRDRPTCFSVGRDSASTLFARAVKRCGIQDLRLHDSRHEAVTRLAKRLSVLELARMVGHRDPRSLMIYYNESAADIARRLG